jgi:hypothetical protein
MTKLVTYSRLLGTKRYRNNLLSQTGLDGLIGAMRSTDEVSTALPDLRAVPLGEMQAIAQAALAVMAQRIIPGSPPTPLPPVDFASSI